MRYHCPALFVLATLALAPFAATQDEPKKEIDRSRGAKLQRVCAAMSALKSVSFETTSTAQPRNAFRAEGKKMTKASGVWANQLLRLELGDDEIVFHGRHMIARDDDNAWCLRRNRLANGLELPFALDPSALFTTLAQKKHKVIHHEVGQVADKPVETYTITLDEKDARTLFWSGSVPKGVMQMNRNGAVRFFTIGVRAGGAAVKPDIKIDLAISFDPATRMVHSIRGRAITKRGATAAGGMMLRARRVGGAQQEEEEDEEEEVKSGTFKNGLPVRPKKDFKNASKADFTFVFKAHNAATAPKLNAAARALLGIKK